MRVRTSTVFQAAWILVMVTGACASARPDGVQQPPAEELTLRPGDAVRLAVKDEPALVGEFPVGTDGTLLLPLVGLIPVAGEPFDAVKERVTKAYANDLTAPVVVLVPLMRISVSGEVRAPSIFVVDPSFTWSEVLARVGGTLPTAARDRMILVRDGREYELKRSGAATWPSFPVRSGDRLVVPRRGWVAENAPILIGSATSVLAAAITTLLLR